MTFPGFSRPPEPCTHKLFDLFQLYDRFALAPIMVFNICLLQKHESSGHQLEDGISET